MTQTNTEVLSVRDQVLAEDFVDPWTAREWNAIYAVGTTVTYHPVRPFGAVEAFETRTRSQAWELSDGTPVVSVEGRTGGVALTHVVVRQAI